MIVTLVVAGAAAMAVIVVMMAWHCCVEAMMGVYMEKSMVKKKK
jgi:hypothetical protein